MNRLLILFFSQLLISLFISKAFASTSEFHLNKINFCKISKQVANDYEPMEFSTSNNLLRKPGEEPMFCGERIIVHGRVLDQNCVPIPDVKVQIWQVDCNGKYPYIPLKNAIDSDIVKVNDDMTFIGHGAATTNNNGEFYFVTVYPRATHDIGPHINVRVKHSKLGELQTIMVLNGKRVMNPGADPELALIAPLVEKMGSKIYHFDIVMPGQGLNSY